MTDLTRPVPTDLAAKWDAYIAWLALTDAERLTRGLPRSKTKFADTLGVSARMLNKYESDERFTTRMHNSGVTPQTTQAAGTAVFFDPEPEHDDDYSGAGDDELDDLSGDERDYQAIKARVIASARKGDPKAIDQYYKTYGRTFVEEEAAARNTDLANLDLADLVSRALLVLAPEELVAALAGSGWSVTPPAPPAPAVAEDAS